MGDLVDEPAREVLPSYRSRAETAGGGALEMGADGGCHYSGDAAGLRRIEDGGLKRKTGNIPEICKFAGIPRLNRCCKSNETPSSSLRGRPESSGVSCDSSVGTPECRHIWLGKSGFRKESGSNTDENRGWSVLRFNADVVIDSDAQFLFAAEVL